MMGTAVGMATFAMTRNMLWNPDIAVTHEHPNLTQDKEAKPHVLLVSHGYHGAQSRAVQGIHPRFMKDIAVGLRPGWRFY